MMSTETFGAFESYADEQYDFESSLFKPTSDVVLGFDPKEIYIVLLNREKKIPIIEYRSLQPESRPLLVSWISSTCSSLGLQVTCLHLAVTILDIFLDNFVVDGKQLQLLALSCIQIAAKFEEREVRVPRLKEYDAYTTTSYGHSLCMQMELKVLEHIKWQVGMPTVAHFSFYYTPMLVDVTDRLKGEKLEAGHVEAVFDQCKEYFFYIINVPLQEILYRKWRPSLLACAVVAAVRKLVDLEPFWPARLKDWSGISPQMFVQPMERMVVAYELAKSNHADIQAKCDLLHKEPAVENDEETSFSSGYKSWNSPEYATMQTPELSGDFGSQDVASPGIESQDGDL